MFTHPDICSTYLLEWESRWGVRGEGLPVVKWADPMSKGAMAYMVPNERECEYVIKVTQAVKALSSRRSRVPCISKDSEGLD